MANDKKVFSAVDAAPMVLYAKRDPSSEKAYPVIANTNGALVLIPYDLVSQAFYDDDGRPDKQPVYIGFANRGVAQSDGDWLLHKNEYNDAGRITSRQIAYDSWDNRATATYA